MENKLKAVIVDDQEDAIDDLCFLLRRYDDLVVAGVAHTGNAGIRLIQKVKPDLLFLDVELPDMTGMSVLFRLEEQVDYDLQVVFYTAYNKYLIDALRSRAFDFLLKPIDVKELETVTRRFYDANSRNNSVSSVRQVLSDDDKPFLLFTPTGDMRVVRPSEIGYFRYVSSRKVWEVALTNGTFLPLRRSTTAEQLCLCGSSFVQIHQSYIVNMNYLVMVKENRCIMYPPFNVGEELQVSRKYRKEMMEKFYQL